MATIYASPYELVCDENGRETRTNFKSQDRAITAWERAVRRNSCFSAHLYFINSAGQIETLADYQSE